MRRLTEGVIGLWWVQVPLRARRFGRTLTLAVTDGFWLTAFRLPAAILPLAALVAGLVVGWQTPGYDRLWTESWWLVPMLVLLASLAAHLSTLFVVGFVIGDFFLVHTAWSLGFRSLDGMLSSGVPGNLARVRVPLLIGYSLLLLLASAVPVTSKGIAAGVAAWSRIPDRLRFPVGAVTHVVAMGAGVWLWSQTVPILVRPIFTWLDFFPTVAAIEPVQQRASLLVGTSVIASVARLGFQYRTAVRPHLGLRMDLQLQRLLDAPPVRSWWDLLPAPVRVVLQALASTLLMSGMLVTRRDALVIFGVSVTLLAIRHRVIPLPIGAYARMVNRVPILIRTAIGAAVVFIASRFVLDQLFRSQPDFGPIVAAVVIGLVVFFLLNPLAETPSRRPGGTG